MPPGDRRFEVKLVKNGKPIKSEVASCWAGFLNGHWIREKPTKPGKYVIGNNNGRVLGEVFAYFYQDELVFSVRDGALCRLKELTGEFWWWSVPMPREMPFDVPRVIDKTDTGVDPPRLYLVK